MTAPKRIRLSRAKGYQKPPGAVVVARPSRWGNPFKVGESIDRDSPLWPYAAELVPGGANGMQEVRFLRTADVVAAYGNWLIEQPALMVSLDELEGRDLACWCALTDPCHADFLLELVAPSASPAKETSR